MNAPEWNAMTDCPELEDLAALHDGRLTEENRARVLEHVATCGACQDMLVELDAYAVEEKPANVVQGRFGWKAFPPAVAAAAVAVFVFLGTRPSGMEKLVAASENVRERRVEARFSADFPYRNYSPNRGPQDEQLNEYAMDSAAADVAGDATARSAKKLQAAGVAYLFLGPQDRQHAVPILVKAAEKQPNDPAILNDLAAAYLATGDDGSALKTADRSLAIQKTPAALWNRALALQGLERNAEAIAAWNQYLQVDPNSPWANEVRTEHLYILQPAVEP